MKKTLIFLTLSAIGFLLTSLSRNEYFEIENTSSVAEVLVNLGDKKQSHQAMMNVKGVSVENGRRLVEEGFAEKPEGGKVSKQSAHFVCISCHNVERDEPNLGVVDAQARMEYSIEKGLPMLQGTSLYGAVNRSTFYNGDYDKKYGDLVKPARNNLREAIQLCAVECAQGRKVEPWEMESILAYLWSIDLKMDDLNLSQTELATIQKATNKGGDKNAAIQLIKSKYLSGVPATFVQPPKNRKDGYPKVVGDANNGKLIYESSCLHCHADQKYSYFDLNNAKSSFDYLDKHFAKYTRYSTYQVVRYGTSPIPGKKAYMPLYTEEKMTNKMMEDLKTYVVTMSK